MLSSFDNATMALTTSYDAGRRGIHRISSVRFEDDATLITALASKQLDLVSTQRAVLAAINDRRPDDRLDVKFVQQSLDLGIALPQGEPALREWINSWIRENFANGKIPELFKSFHDRDLPTDLTERVH